MPKRTTKPPLGPMIHIRLDKTTHRRLKTRVARTGSTIQHLVADLIDREVGKLDKSKKREPRHLALQSNITRLKGVV